MKKNQKDEMIALLQKYSKIKNNLLDHTEQFHDGMHYDIEGYWECVMEGDYDDLETLKNQVKAFTKILEGYKLIRYTFC